LPRRHITSAVKAVVMARKRRAPNYTGALAKPICPEDHYKFTGGLGQPIREPDVAAIRKRAVKQMRLLFKHYKIDPNDEQSWQKLAMSLALAHVPGLQFAKRPKRGRKSTWKTGLGDEWVRAVDDVKSRTDKRTNKAIAELRNEPKWKTYTAQNLGARYREARARQKVLASLHDAWEKGVFFGWLRLPRRRPSRGRTTEISACEKRRGSVGRDALCEWASVVCYPTTTANMRRIENARSCFDAQRLL